LGQRMQCDKKIAIIGQPNVGKSTLVNALVGSYASEVANWPGVTVDVKVIETEYEGIKLCLLDLPGCYSLSGGSEEERVTAKFLLTEKYDNILIIADATVLRRSMYLVLQVLELKGIGVITINKIDMAMKAGIHINTSLLSKRLKKPVVLVSAAESSGIDTLIDELLKPQQEEYVRIEYGDLEYFVVEMSKLLEGRVPGNPRWFAAEFLLGNSLVEELLRKLDVYKDLSKLRELAQEEVKDIGRVIINSRWKKIDEILEGVIEYERVIESGSNIILEKLDAILLNPVSGILASFLILIGILTLAFTINTGFPLNVIFESLGLKNVATVLETYSISGILGMMFDRLASFIASSIPYPWGDLIGNGIIVGVGTVLSFFPLIFTVYFLLALLEDSGVAARIAVAMDPVFRPVGLSGKAIFPIVISMGCNVAGVPATRVLRSRKAKIAAILGLSFIPCQARLVVLLAIASVLPPLLRSLSIAFIYLVSLLLFMSVAFIYIKFTKKEQEEYLILELPPYHVPKLRVINWMAWDNAKHFLKKAGTVILVFSIILWLVTNTGPHGFVKDVDEGWGALLGKLLTPLTHAILMTNDYASWIISFSMIAGAVAKEVTLETLAVLTGTSNAVKIVKMLGLNYAQTVALMVGITLYIPCVATIAAIYSETKSMKITLGALILSITISMVISALTLRILLVMIS